jgi:hypothetical protein
LDVGGCCLEALPAQLPCLQDSKVALSLDGNVSLGVAGAPTLQPLVHLASLTRLSMGCCGLQPAALQLLQCLPALEELPLDYNGLLGQGPPGPMLQALRGLSTLRALSLCGCGFYSRSVVSQLEGLAATGVHVVLE